MVSPRLVGRAAELDRLAAVLTAPPAVAVVEGEAGVGKSRLVEELVRLPGLADRRFARGWCRPIREPFPLAPFIDAVRGLGAAIPPGRLSPVAGALRPLLPELADVLPPTPEPLDDRAAQRHRVFRGMVEVLASVGPLVLVLEDLHWADGHTVDLVAYLLGDPPPTLSLVVTLRTEDASAEVRALMSRAPARVGLTRILLTPLDAAGTASLAAAILDTAAVPAELSDLLYRRTSGLPFAVEELLALLRERGLLVRENGYRLNGSPAELDVPAGVRDPVLGRLAGLSDDGRAVVRAAAVLQAPVEVPLLAATSRLPPGRLSQALEEALRSGLLVPHDRGVGFRHLLATHAVYGDTPEPLRRILHERAADALATAEPVPLGQLAHHLRRAGRLAEWVDVAERGADRAVEVGHHQEAARLLEEVLRDAPLDPARRGRIAAKLGRAAMATAPVRQHVTDLLAQALEHDLPRRLRGEVRYWLGLLYGETGVDPHPARRLLAQAVADLDGDPEMTATATAAVALRAVAEAPPEDPRPWLHRALTSVDRVTGTTSRVYLLGKIAATMLVIGDPAWVSQVDRMQALTGGRPQGRLEVHAYYLVGTSAALAGHHDRAHWLLAQGLAGVSGCGDLRQELLLRSVTAVTAYLRGAWEGLSESLERLAGEVSNFPPARIDVELVGSGLALAEGDLPRAEALLSLAATRADRVSDFLFLPFGATLAIAWRWPGATPVPPWCTPTSCWPRSTTGRCGRRSRGRFRCSRRRWSPRAAPAPRRTWSAAGATS